MSFMGRDALVGDRGLTTSVSGKYILELLYMN